MTKYNWKEWLNKPIHLKANKRILSIFLREISVLLQSGVKANEALDILVRQKELKALHPALRTISTAVTNGERLSDSFSKDKQFNTFFASMIRLGEETGRLPQITKSLAKYYNREYELERKIQQAMIYPVILTFTMIGVLAFLFQYVIPTFVSLLEDQEQALPLSTKILLAISYFVQNYFLWLLLGLFLLIAIFIFCYRDRQIRYYIDGIKSHLPILSHHYKIIMTGKLARALSIVAANGMPFLDGLKIVHAGITDEYFYQHIEDIIEQIESGTEISKAFQAHGITSDLFHAMLDVGEKTGALSDTLEDVSAFYDEETTYSLQILIRIFEPALILFMALIVGFVVISIATPMFDLVNHFDYS